jgi:hypothetical protein
MIILGLGVVSLLLYIPKWFSWMHVVNRVEVSKAMNFHSNQTRHEHVPPPVIYTSKTKLHKTNNAKTVMLKIRYPYRIGAPQRLSPSETRHKNGTTARTANDENKSLILPDISSYHPAALSLHKLP